jgi:hypothetical protein
MSSAGPAVAGQHDGQPDQAERVLGVQRVVTAAAAHGDNRALAMSTYWKLPSGQKVASPR